MSSHESQELIDMGTEKKKKRKRNRKSAQHDPLICRSPQRDLGGFPGVRSATSFSPFPPFSPRDSRKGKRCPISCPSLRTKNVGQHKKKKRGGKKKRKAFRPASNVHQGREQHRLLRLNTISGAGLQGSERRKKRRKETLPRHWPKRSTKHKAGTLPVVNP